MFSNIWIFTIFNHFDIWKESNNQNTRVHHRAFPGFVTRWYVRYVILRSYELHTCDTFHTRNEQIQNSQQHQHSKPPTYFSKPIIPNIEFTINNTQPPTFNGTVLKIGFPFSSPMSRFDSASLERVLYFGYGVSTIEALRVVCHGVTSFARFTIVIWCERINRSVAQ